MFKVVCIKSHSLLLVKKGEIYNVSNTLECCHTLYDVGIKSDCNLLVCICGELHSNTTHWISSTLFEKLDETFAEETLSQIKEQIEEEYLALI